MAKIAQYRDSSDDQLNEQLVKLKKEQFNLRFQRASGQLENTARVRVVRHDIARIMTLLNQRGATANVAAPAAKEAKPKKAKAEKKAAAPKTASASEDKKQPAKKSRAKKE